AKSPLTGGFGEAEAGGFWGPELKGAGFDAVIVEGVADTPVYLYINDGSVEFKDASHLWGKTTQEAQSRIREELGDRAVRVLQIGPAGENLVKFACIVNELKHANGRCGLGAVMGSKRLRAIAVRGHKRPEMADPERIRELRTWFAKRAKEHAGLVLHSRLGTSKGVLPLNASGILPTRNFQEGQFEGAASISGEEMEKKLLTGTGTCYGCPVACKRVVSSTEGYQIDPEYGGPEYETIGTLGSGCGVRDLAAVCKANELCNAYGMDTISAGLTVAFAMECFERGLLSRSQTDGIDLRFGNGEAVVTLIEKMAFREGIGDLLANGSREAGREIGGSAMDYANQVKGQEFPAHEPRAKWGVALGYAVSPTGADHLQAAHDLWFEKDLPANADWITLHDLKPLGLLEPVPAQSIGPDKVRMFTYLQDIWGLVNVLDLCIFVAAPEFSAYSLNQIADMVEAASGWNTSLAELQKMGERGVNMARCFNIREGFGFADDKLPPRLHEPLRGGPFEGYSIPRGDFDEAVRLYYQMRNWELPNGIPTRGKLLELDVKWLAEMMDEWRKVRESVE
ncbi:MAG: aldehyde ferredoxin oxidoreductase family protein, partial [Firmicutes bacterium]|nr:aldehyde ferredoxin oxidoreductase family protein [Bacillota bacterium]